MLKKVRFSHIEAGNFNVPYERCWCNLEATLENLVNGYLPYGNYGVYNEAHIITKIERITTQMEEAAVSLLDILAAHKQKQLAKNQ